MNTSTLLLIIVILSLLILAHQRNHILITLLRLEFLILSIAALALFNIGNNINLHTFTMPLILTLGAIEASLGLALLISITRKSGSDLTSSLTIIKC